jgi:hypothetical protein
MMDDIMQMKSQGIGEDVIINQLRARGATEQDIMNAMSQSQIKQAVAGGNMGQNILGQSPPMGIDQSSPIPPNQFPGQQGPPQFGDPYNQGFNGMQNPQMQGDFYADGRGGPMQYDPYSQAPSPGQDPYNGAYSAQPGDPYGPMPEGSGEYTGMQPSMLSQGMPQAGGEYAAAEGMQDPYGAEAYQMYQPYQDVMSSDVITEISEQIVNERLSVLHEKIEKILDMKTVVEANMTNLNDRLKRMEKIVDQMQVSILKKVGEYMTDIQDVKQELEETQKSFVAIQNTRPSTHSVKHKTEKKEHHSYHKK